MAISAPASAKRKAQSSKPRATSVKSRKARPREKLVPRIQPELTLSKTPAFVIYNNPESRFRPFISTKRHGVDLEAVTQRAIALATEILNQRGKRNVYARHQISCLLCGWRKNTFTSYPLPNVYRTLHAIDKHRRSPIVLEAYVLGVEPCELVERYLVELFGIGGDHVRTATGYVRILADRLD